MNQILHNIRGKKIKNKQLSCLLIVFLVISLSNFSKKDTSNLDKSPAQQILRHKMLVAYIAGTKGSKATNIYAHNICYDQYLSQQKHEP